MIVTKLKLLKLTLLTKLAGGEVKQREIKKLIPILSLAAETIKIQEQEIEEIRRKYLNSRNINACLRGDIKKLENQVKLNGKLKKFIAANNTGDLRGAL